MPIPHIVHHTWKTNFVPSHLAPYVQSWRTHHPSWRHYFWTDEDAVQFIFRYFRWFLPYFERYSSDVMRADAFRYILLYSYGGIYADLDYECYRSFYPLVLGTELLLGWEWEGTPDEAMGMFSIDNLLIAKEWFGYGNTLGNAIMASCPRHPLWLAVINELIKQHPGSSSQANRSIWNLTGPAFLTQVVLDVMKPQWNSLFVDQSVLFPIYWHPPEIDDGHRYFDHPNAFGAHHWAGTWWQPQPFITSAPIYFDTQYDTSKSHKYA